MTFTTEFIAKLDKRFTAAELKFIKELLEVHCDGYDIKPKTREVVLATDCMPECYKVFMVAKKIEGCSDNTLNLYQLYLEQFFTFARMPLTEITNNTIRRFLFEVKKGKNGKELSDSTIDNYRRVLSSFFTWALNEGYISKNPIATVKKIKYLQKEKHALTDEEMTRVREACKDIREKAILEVLYSTGVRVSELCDLNYEDVDLISRRIIVRCGKGKKMRETYLSGKAVVFLKMYLEQRKDSSNALFVSRKKPYDRMQPGGIQRMLAQIGERAGLTFKVHPHMLRRTFATDALDHGMMISDIQTLLGHAKPETTMIYAQIKEENIKSAHRKAII